jgi:SWI/SNF-related matrix-associated actin-dependent regulator of chromatin subfamily A-like protein 1
MLDIVEINNGYEVSFAYKPWIVAGIKKIPGVYFKGSTKKWVVPKASEAALMNWAKALGFTAKETQAPTILEIEPMPELTIDLNLKMPLFPYQRQGVAYNLLHKKVIVGDQPGLGKTAQSIGTAEATGVKCVLIICPATLRENWKREVEEKWTNHKAIILNDRVKNTWHTFFKVGMVKYFICNYESLKKYFVESINRPIGKDGKQVPLRLNHIKFKSTIEYFDMIIVDEVHRCKDGKTQQSKFVMGLAKGKEYVLALTGTPVVNKPVDLIPQLHIIEQLSNFGGYKGFLDTYCQGVNQASNLKHLNYLMHKHCFYRREKTEVLKDLPDKMRNIITVDIDNRADYVKAENDLRNYLKENLGKTDEEISKSLRGEVMVMISILKRIAAKGKIPHMIEHITEVTEAGEKIVVFAWHKEIVMSLKDAISGAVTIVGDDSMDARQRAVDNFQNDPKVQVIICNIKSGGVGITLTASSRVSFIELPWHPADCEQCEDRTHRIGQKNSVQVCYLIGANTIDEYIYDIIEKKRTIVNQVTGADDNIETVEMNMVDQLIGIFSKEK